MLTKFKCENNSFDHTGNVLITTAFFWYMFPQIFAIFIHYLGKVQVPSKVSWNMFPVTSERKFENIENINWWLTNGLVVYCFHSFISLMWGRRHFRRLRSFREGVFIVLYLLWPGNSVSPEGPSRFSRRLRQAMVTKNIS